MIKAVIFDLDDTLYAYEALNIEAGRRAEEFACGKLGITADKYQEAYRFGRTETKRQLGDVGASHNRLLYFQKTLEYLGVKPMPLSLRLYEIYWGTFLENMRLYPGVRQLIDRLHEKGIVIAVCTDLTAHIQHRKLEALGLCDDISYLITSEEAGKEKPAPEIFDLCLRKLGMTAGEVCYIGDNYRKDIEGAASAGMQTVWFHPEQDAGRQYAELMEHKLL
ncbi:MAG: HAD-IA family hydrolase [Lachnospiraceae bacterium]|nr:HAD-IA family hydrolase [Lachnospiraceae bacterium]